MMRHDSNKHKDIKGIVSISKNIFGSNTLFLATEALEGILREGGGCK
tara:strand:- start:2344 stop:2484 length:141 start_codon:yes stop_codon:yes gene_type:complete